jgi:hypothetical protein
VGEPADRLVCAACGHVIGPRDGCVYRVIDGREGVWCPTCVPDRKPVEEDEAARDER